MAIQRIRSFAVAEVLLTLALAQTGSAQQPQAGPTEKAAQSPRDTLIIGTVRLKLGMSEDSVLRALAMQYDVSPSSGRFHTIMTRKPVDLVGTLWFNDQGNLVAAMKYWTSNLRHYHGEEIGRALYTLIGRLLSEDACSIGASQLASDRPQPEMVRQADIECGKKRISITIWGGTNPEMQITEAIGDQHDASRIGHRSDQYR